MTPAPGLPRPEQPPLEHPPLELPARPDGDLAEFGPRYEAGERIARRYAAAVAAVATYPAAVAAYPREHRRLVANWPTVRGLLERIGRLCKLGVAAAPGGVRPKRKGGRPRGRQQRPADRRRRLHEVHRRLSGLETAVDAAVAVAVTIVLAADEAGRHLSHGDDRRAEIEIWLSALGAALTELDRPTTSPVTLEED